MATEKKFLRIAKLKAKKSIAVRADKVAEVPKYIQKNAERGLDLLEFAGDGLTQKTIREARLMRDGKVSDDKAKRMAAWFARHISDLDSPSADDYVNGDSERPTAGQVAWLLWGGDLGKNTLRAMKWAADQSSDEEKSAAVTDSKHIRGIRETDDSIIIEFGKSDPDDADYEDEEDEKRSFLKGCVLHNSKKDQTNVRRFSTKIDIAPAPSEPVYDGNRIIDYQNVSFRGYASTNESVTKGDRIGDYLRKGAFKKTIKEFKKNPVMLTDHENTTKNIAGSYTQIEEDDRGLFVEGKISNAPALATIRTLVAEGHLKTLSIGGMFYYEDDGKGISQVDLMEVSLVAIPMNPDARFEAVQ